MKKSSKNLIPGLKKSSKKSEKSNELILSLRAQQVEWTDGAEFKDPSPELGVRQMTDITIILND